MGQNLVVRARVIVVAAALLFVGGAAAAAPATPHFQATLRGDSHRPAAGEEWHFTVRAVDAAGRPVSGTAIVRVLVRGKVVDTVGWFGFDGTLRRTYRWSTTLKGSTAVLEAKVVGPGGARTVTYDVRVTSAWAASTGRPAFRMTLAGTGRTPVAGTRWGYVVRAFDTSGRPVAGTAVVRVVVRSRVVDTVGWFGFKGTLQRAYRWSKKLRGASAVLQAKVVGPGGTRVESYAVRVR